MPYKIKEIFYSIQGEGFHSGRPAVFIRFSGCNLWNGLESGRESAICKFCDTDFVGGETFQDAESVADAARFLVDFDDVLCILTGGEPALQIDSKLVSALKEVGFVVAVETNGTRPIPGNLDWVTVSPKAGTELMVRSGDEIKVVFPQDGIDLDRIAKMDFDHFYLQPMEGPNLEENIKGTVSYCMPHPSWSISIQSHKILGLR